MKTVSLETIWFAVALGVSAGILAWAVGLHKTILPSHPQLLLSALVFGVTALSAVVLKQNEHRNSNRA